MFIQYEAGISAISDTDGRQLWEFPINACCSSSAPAVADGLVFFGGGGYPIPDAHFYALNATTGALVWRLPVPYGADSSPAIANGLIYVGSGIGSSAGELLAVGEQLPPAPPSVTILYFEIGAPIALALILLAIVLERRKNQVGKN